MELSFHQLLKFFLEFVLKIIYIKMDSLNDDCQLLIIKNLSLRDQLALFEASIKEPTNRLNSNVRYTWQQKFTFFLNFNIFEYFDENPKLMNDFLSIISQRVQRLELHNVKLSNLKCWTRYRFPNMRTLEYSMADSCDAENNGDIFTKFIAELFSELNDIKPYGKFNCIYLKNLPLLRKLDLGECTSVFDCDEIGELKLLEELILPNLYFKRGISNMFLSLPKLRTFTFYMDSEHHNDFVSGTRAKDIEKITFSDSLWEFSLLTLKRLINLRQLTILDDKSFLGEELQELIIALPRLERLDIIKCELWKSEIELWQTVACCPSLKILNISNMKLNADFFHISRSPMEKVLDKRSIPLTLHCHDTGKYEDLIRLYFNHPKLKVSLAPLKINHIDLKILEVYNSVQLNFMPREEIC